MHTIVYCLRRPKHQLMWLLLLHWIAHFRCQVNKTEARPRPMPNVWPRGLSVTGGEVSARLLGALWRCRWVARHGQRMPRFSIISSDHAGHCWSSWDAANARVDGASSCAWDVVVMAGNLSASTRYKQRRRRQQQRISRRQDVGRTRWRSWRIRFTTLNKPPAPRQLVHYLVDLFLFLQYAEL